MKKILALILALTLVFALVACGETATTTEPAETTEPATEAKTFTVGICQLVQHDALDAATQGFKDALTEAFGDAVTFDEQNAQGDSATCSTIVTGFVANDYDLIMANATPALQAAVSATTEIPVLGTSVTDYATALNMDFNVTDGTGINVSGTSDGVPGQLYADLVNELVPDAQKVSLLYCSAEPNSEVQAKDFIPAMEAYGATCESFTFADSNDLQSVVTAAIAECDALYIPTDNTAASNMTIVRNVCEAAGVPIICGEENMCAAGGLATVSISYYDIGHLCGEQAVAILSGEADVATMPIGYAQNPVKKYSADYAAAIGFEMPEGFEVIGG